MSTDPHFGRAGLGGTVLELGRRLIHAMSVLRSAGHEVEWVGDWSGDPGDEHILATAAAHGQVLVTLDKEFGELAVLYRRPHAGFVRPVNLRAQDQGPVCVPLLSVVTVRNSNRAPW